MYTLESGAYEITLITADQPQDGLIGSRFTENNQTLGGIRFQFFSNGQFFKIESVVDSNCQPITSYSNMTPGRDKNVLQNWESLRIKFGNQDYQVWFEHTPDVELSFREISP